MGKPVIALGVHVYDGYHTGWHEFHPLMAVRRIDPDTYLTWKPVFLFQTLPKPLNPSDPPLTATDMEAGLGSETFRKRCELLRDTWCEQLKEALKAETRQVQQKLEHRWTIHPTVDGCRPSDSAQPPLH